MFSDSTTIGNYGKSALLSTKVQSVPFGFCVTTVAAIALGAGWNYGSYNEVPTLVFTPTQVSASVRPDLEEILKKINSYLALEDDWDGYGGVAPNASTVVDAKTFISFLSEESVVPRPGISGDGEINLFWEQGFYIDVGFTGNATYSFYAKDEHGKEYFGDEIPLKSGLSKLIQDLIS